MKEWCVAVKGFDDLGDYRVWADTRGKARAKVWRSAKDAGYKVAFTDIRVVLAC
jgi:hypothetical protein